jgi:hypothetical protein
MAWKRRKKLCTLTYYEWKESLKYISYETSTDVCSVRSWAHTTLCSFADMSLSNFTNNLGSKYEFCVWLGGKSVHQEEMSGSR